MFLLVVFDPVRGSAIKALREVRFREPTDFRAIPRQRREEARMLAEVERSLRGPDHAVAPAEACAERER